MKARELELIGRYTDGGATSDEVRELEVALRGDAELRRTFLSYMNLDAALTGSAPALRIVKGEAASRTSRPFTRWIGWAAAAAIVLFAFIVATSQRGSRTRAVQPFVTLAAANDAVWSDPNVELALRSGELPPGALRLESGSAEFLCADGATVLLRGPAAVRFPERKRVFVESGRIFCRCPSPESRLAVSTLATEILDLGTEFAVEARADRSTLVSVLSGEVQVGREAARRLRKGEAVEVRGDGILAIKPLAREEFAELLAISPSANEAVQHGQNLLRDPAFENGLSEQTWNGTETNIEATHAGRSGGGVRVFARGYAQWPQCRQKLKTGDIAGKLVVASAWGASASDDPLRPKQGALLKLVFLDEKGRDFAFAIRRFLDGRSAAGRFEQAQVAAFAPPGTREVQIQLMLRSERQDSGSVIFDDASLIIADAEREK